MNTGQDKLQRKQIEWGDKRNPRMYRDDRDRPDRKMEINGNPDE